MYKLLNVNKRIENGKEKEVNVLIENPKAKIVQVTLRKNKIMESHKTNVPIIIQCIAGYGQLVVENGIDSKQVSLSPGTVIAIEAEVFHSITAKPSVSIVLIKLSNS